MSTCLSMKYIPQFDATSGQLAASQNLELAASPWCFWLYSAKELVNALPRVFSQCFGFLPKGMWTGYEHS